ncbi:MAG: hypothetical protein KBC83_03445 [Candidatus Moranbacteria bacterium]|nr:hypothetical protein [Candidatus Moranbacteria bacterium]MBP9801691.1 hypothetical protein [Candidatus Moranbacteria bacterium]
MRFFTATANESGGVVLHALEPEEQQMLFQMKGIKRNCGGTCDDCPASAEGCGAPTEGATLH